MSDPSKQLKRRYAPGFWEDMNGHMHISAPEILAHLGLPDTAENRDLAMEMVKEVLRDKSPDTMVVRQELNEGCRVEIFPRHPCAGEFGIYRGCEETPAGRVALIHLDNCHETKARFDQFCPV
jgi:hypothetical protein